jgi:transcriptional regulator with XRE-family HTH domain
VSIKNYDSFMKRLVQIFGNNKINPDKLSINTSTFYNYKNGTTCPGVKQLFELADILNKPITYFFENEGTENLEHTVEKLTTENKHLAEKLEYAKKIIELAELKFTILDKEKDVDKTDN